MAARNKSRSTTFPEQLLAGGVAGTSEILLMYPLDVVKTRLQLQKATDRAVAYRGMVDCFKKIIAHEGFGRLYRGIAAPILMETPKRATKFAANDAWSRFYARLSGTSKTQPLAIITGASAGATEALVVVPFELVKIRLQDQNATGRYNGILDCAKQIVRQSGPLGLYQGFESTVWRHIVWNAGYFGCIYQVRSLMPAATTKQGTMMNDVVAGSVGGTVGTLLNTPLDVVKSRIQSGAVGSGGGQEVPWVWPEVLAVYKAEGIAALYKGLVPKLVRFAPGGGILLVVYTFVIDLLASR